MTYAIESFTGHNKFLSNFSLDSVSYCGILYPTSEHAYQAAKTEDESLRRFVATQLETPAAAKNWGKRVKLRKDWEAIKVNIMREIVWLKFKQNASIRLELLETEGIPLIEGNTWGDTFWGTCQGKGENHLGKILMEVRNYFSTTNFWERLRFLNTLRCNNYFHKLEDWSNLEYAGCLAGEAGEVVDVVKKAKRENREPNQQDLADEVGDVLAYLDLLCSKLGISLENAVRSKFNEVSKERLTNCQLIL
jgi:ribA/ribD-fused uncharacterized protein